MKSFYRRVDGKDMNLQYRPDNVQFTGKKKRVIAAEAPNAQRSYSLE